MAALPPTKLIFAGLIAALEAALGHAAPGHAGGAGLADVFDRFDGDPEDAVMEHVADLQGGTGTSVLVGFTADQATQQQRGPDGRALTTTLPVTVLVVRRRSQREAYDPEGESVTRQDAEALDDAMDAVLEAIDTLDPATLRASGAEHLLFSGSVGLVGSVDWYGRALTFDVTRLARKQWQSAGGSVATLS